MNFNNVLIVVAHPDGEVLGNGGCVISFVIWKKIHEHDHRLLR
jgi:LmbE family N-acetylglucosaminyl deacetylase